MCFTLMPDQPLAFVRMYLEGILVLREVGTPIGNPSGNSGRAVVVSVSPLLECGPSGGGQPERLPYARPGWTCAIAELGRHRTGRGLAGCPAPHRHGPDHRAATDRNESAALLPGGAPDSVTAVRGAGASSGPAHRFTRSGEGLRFRAADFLSPTRSRWHRRGMAAPEIDVKKVAHLARLRLTPDEEQRFGEQLSHVIGYVSKLSELDVTGVEPTAHAMPRVNVTRPDEVFPSLSQNEALRNAPAQANGLFMVPKIVE